LLNISQIESGRLRFNYTIMRLEDLVSDIAEDLAAMAKKKGLSLNYQPPKNPLPVLNLMKKKLINYLDII